MSMTCSFPVVGCSFLQSSNLIRKIDDVTSFSELRTFQALKEMAVIDEGISYSKSTKPFYFYDVPVLLILITFL